jgi:hypothetical protein
MNQYLHPIAAGEAEKGMDFFGMRGQREAGWGVRETTSERFCPRQEGLSRTVYRPLE